MFGSNFSSGMMLLPFVRKVILALVKTIRKTLLKAIAVGVKTIAIGREMGLNY